MSTRCILIIDDEERIREAIQVSLKILGGWRVITAASGAEGLLQAQTEHPDAILLDIAMPDMDGEATLQQLRSHPLTASIPVILVTAKAQLSDQSHYAQLGVAGVVIKPFDPFELAEYIRTTLGWSV
jgi:CheY-like chemotaxis protein